MIGMTTRYFSELVDALSACKSKPELRDFLVGILTPREMQELPTRLKVVKLLKKGVSQHLIAKKLGIGIATVTRGSKELQKGRFAGISWQRPVKRG